MQDLRLTHLVHTVTHGFAVRVHATLGTFHMAEETAHAITYADSPVKAAAVAAAALFTHHATHKH